MVGTPTNSLLDILRWLIGAIHLVWRLTNNEQTPQSHSLTRITRLIQGITLKLRPLLPLLRHHPTGRIVTSTA